jgi:hypothetical protein
MMAPTPWILIYPPRDSVARAFQAAETQGALEAEHGYDLSKAMRRRVGRPSLAGGGASPRMSFRATPDLYRAAQERPSRKDAWSATSPARPRGAT